MREDFFLVLNAHATMLARGKIPPDDLRVAFNSFVMKAKKFRPQLPNKEPTSCKSVIDNHKDWILAILPDELQW